RQCRSLRPRVGAAGRDCPSVTVECAPAAAGTRMRLRAATPADVPSATTLWNAALGQRFPLRSEILSLTVFDDPSFRVGDALCAVDRGDVVAFGWCKRTDSAAFIGGLVVHPDRQRQGIGTQMLSAL